MKSNRSAHSVLDAAGPRTGLAPLKLFRRVNCTALLPKFISMTAHATDIESQEHYRSDHADADRCLPPSGR